MEFVHAKHTHQLTVFSPCLCLDVLNAKMAANAIGRQVLRQVLNSTVMTVEPGQTPEHAHLLCQV